MPAEHPRSRGILALLAAPVRLHTHRQQYVVRGRAPRQHHGILKRHAGDADWPVNGRASMRTWPAVGNCRPVASFINVDLPHQRTNNGHKLAFTTLKIQAFDSKSTFDIPVRFVTQGNVLDRNERFRGHFGNDSRENLKVRVQDRILRRTVVLPCSLRSALLIQKSQRFVHIPHVSQQA